MQTNHTTTGDPVQEVLSRLRKVKPTGERKWSACCPAHDDATPSLAIGVGDDGRVLLNCFAQQCTVDAICKAVGMHVADLFPTNGSVKPVIAVKPAFATLESYAATLGNRNGGTWIYTDCKGAAVLGAVRINADDGGKEFKQLHPVPGGWAFGAPKGPLLLYRLADIIDADTLYIFEGERCADEGKLIGYPTSTTWAGGCNSVKKTDWSVTAGKTVFIFPDNDLGGMKAAELIACITTGLDPPAMVKIIRLPGLEEGGDIIDYVARKDSVDTVDIKRGIDELIEATPWFVPCAAIPKSQPKPVRDAVEWQPFPLDVFTERIQRIILRASEAMGVDPAMLAIPHLAVFAGVIGNSRRLVIEHGWNVPAILWTCIVADSGTAKTPAIEFASRSLYRLYDRAIREHKDAVQQYNATVQEWKAKPEAERGSQPVAPTLARVVIDDVTIECVAPIHAENLRGLVMVKDELAGWWGGFDQYRAKGRGTDVANWEQLHNGGALIVDRKGGSGAPRLRIYIRPCAVSVTGGVQLATLIRVLKPEHFESGLVARVLFAMPPERLRQWTDVAVSEEDELSIDGIIDRLYELAPDYDRNGAISPKYLGMNTAAKAAYERFFNEHNQQLHNLHGDLKSAWSKREGYVGRCALVLHLSRWAAGEPGVNPDQLDEASLHNAIKLVRWFAYEDRRVYAALSEGSAEREDRELIQLIESRGGKMSVREIMRITHVEDAGQVETTLNRLVKAGAGHWTYDDRGGGPGAPKRVFVLGGHDLRVPSSGLSCRPRFCNPHGQL